MGYAGLRQLQHMKTLPVDVLKIDKAFVDGLPDDSSMVQAIIQMAQKPHPGFLLPKGLKLKRNAPGWPRRAWRADKASFLPLLFLRMSLNNDTFLALTTTQKCNFVAGLCEPAQSS